MYALIDIAGYQIKIEEGKNIKIPLQNKKIGSKIILDNVLFYNDGSKSKVGAPYIKSLSFEGKIISHNKENKIVVYKKKRRKGYEKKRGHQQSYSVITVSKLSSKQTKKKPATTTKKITKKVSKK